MMRICVDARMIFDSGIGTIIQNFLANFKDDFLLLVIGDNRKITPFLDGKKNYTIIQTEVPIYSISEQIILPLLIPSCDLFWSPHYNIPLFYIRAKWRVANINDVFHIAFSQTLSLPKRVYSAFLLSQAFKRSDKIITISSFSFSEIIKYLGSKQSHVAIIPCGLNHDLFRVIEDDEALRQVQIKYNLPSKFILCVGNVKPHKNLRRLVQAFSSLGEAVKGHKLVIVGKKEGFRSGDSSLFNEIENDSFLSQNIQFTGFVPNADLPILYNLASLFVFPSLYEGFGLPPLEAMACGCPVLVSRTASIPEICGDNAKYFDPKKIDDIALNLLKALSSNNEDQYIHNGLAHVKKFLWTNYYDMQIALFRKQIEKK